MKIGILDFRYGHSARFAARLKRKGNYSINLGDWVQTLAVHRLLARLGVPEEEIVRVDRDSLPVYEGPPVRLIMNAAFLDHSFPLPPTIEPLFIGFQTSSRDLIRTHEAYFRKHQPIGCRDNDTKSLFAERGIRAFTTGCLSITLPKRKSAPVNPKPFFIAGEGNGALPKRIKKFAPVEIRNGSEYKHQRKPATTLPLSDDEAAAAETSAAELLDCYSREAGLVITPLLHAATPCLAMGIPVILARNDFRDRFSAIAGLLPVYTPGQFGRINWNPDPVEVEALKEGIADLVRARLDGDPPPAGRQAFLDSCYPPLKRTTEAERGTGFWRRFFPKR